MVFSPNKYRGLAHSPIKISGKLHPVFITQDHMNIVIQLIKYQKHTHLHTKITISKVFNFHEITIVNKGGPNFSSRKPQIPSRVVHSQSCIR